MTSKKTDQVLLLLGIVLILISSYQLFLWRMNQDSLGFSLATLEHTKSVVKIKSFSALDWRDAFSGSEIGEKQLIYTDADSSADIKFNQGHTISIGENSLIRVSSLGPNSALNVERGLIRAKIDGNKPLVIEFNGSEMTLTGKNADVQISLHGDSGEIGVLSGEVSVQKAGQTEIINKDHALIVEAGGLTKELITFTQTNPLPDQILYTVSETYPLEFSWTPVLPGEVLLSNHPSMKGARVFRGEGTARADLIPGVYYWKVEDENESSLMGSFHVIREYPLKVLRPLDAEKIVLAKDANTANELFLQWKGTPGENYMVEWVNQEDHHQSVKASGVLIPVHHSGAFSWRVKVDSPERPLAQWSSWQNLEITLVDLPAVPQNLSPIDLELQSYSKEEFDVDLNWEAEGIVELEVLDPKNVKATVLVKDRTHLLKVKDPGRYRWRLRGVDQFKRSSEWSEWRSFTLEDLSHEVSTEGFQRIQLKRPDQSVTFNWKSGPGTNTVFELSESKDFAELIVKKDVAGEEVSVVVPKVGNYYWRSRHYSADGTFSVSEPKKVIIEPAPAPAKPEKLPDLEVPLEWEETTYQRHWWDAFISTAFADDLKGVAKINLPFKEDASKYIIRIFSDPKGEHLILERTLESKIMDWKNAKAGQYYWQYALIDYWGRTSPFSDLSSLNLTGMEPILPQKAKLISPIRAAQVEAQDISLKWTSSEKNRSYLVEVSASEDFDNIVFQKHTSSSELEIKTLPPDFYYWRVTSSNGAKTLTSSTGRFVILPPVEKITIVTKKEKAYSKRASLAFSPSSDTYEFKNGSGKGKIDGTTLNSFEGRTLWFTEKYILSADLLRQSGKVFDGEKYLFQRFQLHGTWKKKVKDHLWGPGLSLGSVAGYSYSASSAQVSSSTITGFIYGPHLEGFYTLSERWELQGKLAYMLGAIPHTEVSTEANYQMKNFYLVMGLNLSMREYDKNDGSQTSLRVSLGLGKEF